MVGARLGRTACLTQDDKAGLVGGETEHDEVSVKAVEAVARVGVPAGAAALLPDVCHDLVLTLPRHIRIRQDHLRSQDCPCEHQ